MLHNEARNLLVEAYEKTHDAKAVALAYGVSVPAEHAAIHYHFVFRSTGWRSGLYDLSRWNNRR